MPMATKAPTTTIHPGRLEGTFKARRIPVTKALPSVMVRGPLMRYFWITHSKNRLAIMANKKTRRASKPK